MVNAALFVLRATFGGLMMGHGSQKAFGWFGGPGLTGTKGWLQSMGYPADEPWAEAAALSEFGGGALTALGFLGPIGPALTVGAMTSAAVTVHKGKPIWVTAGGAELPVTNIAIATALMLAGPGDWSLDRLLGIKVPRWLAIPAVLAPLGGVAYGVWVSQRNLEARQQQAQPEMPVQEATTPTQAGTDQPRSADQAQADQAQPARA